MKIIEDLKNLVQKMVRRHSWESGDMLVSWLETEVNPELRQYGIGLHRMSKFERLSEEEKAEIPGTVEWFHALREQISEERLHMTTEEWDEEMRQSVERFQEARKKYKENPSPISTYQSMTLYLMGLPERGVPTVQHIIDIARRAVDPLRYMTREEYFKDDRNLICTLYHTERTIAENQTFPKGSQLCLATFRDLEFSLPRWIKDNQEGRNQHLYKEMKETLISAIDDLYHLLDTLKYAQYLPVDRQE